MCVCNDDQMTRLPAYKEEFLASMVKVSMTSSISNAKRLTREHKLGRILHLIQKSDNQHHKKLFLLILH